MSKSVSPKRVGAIFANHELIQSLRQNAKKIKPIQEFINSFLDPEIASRFVVASADEDYIVLVADSSAWAAKIRYLIPLMLDNFARHEQLKWVKQIQVKILKHDQYSNEQQHPKAMAPSQRSRHHINAFADSVADEELAAALRRLAEGKY